LNKKIIKIYIYISIYFGYLLELFLKTWKNFKISLNLPKNKNPSFCNSVKFRTKEEAGWNKFRVKPRVGDISKKGVKFGTKEKAGWDKF
jgi:hypothetical protein